MEQAVPAAIAVPELVAIGSAAGKARFAVSDGVVEADDEADDGADDETIVTVEVGVEVVVVVAVVVAADAALCKNTPGVVVAAAESALAEPL